MSIAAIIFLILWLLTGIAFIGVLVTLIIFLLKRKGGSPISRGIFVIKHTGSDVQKFWAKWHGHQWWKTSGSKGEFMVTETSGWIFSGKGFDHRIEEGDYYMHHGKEDSVLIAGLKHIDLDYQEDYNKLLKKYNKLQNENSKLRHDLHQALTQIEKHSNEKASFMVGEAAKVLQSTRNTKQSSN